MHGISNRETCEDSRRSVCIDYYADKHSHGIKSAKPRIIHQEQQYSWGLCLKTCIHIRCLKPVFGTLTRQRFILLNIPPISPHPFRYQDISQWWTVFENIHSLPLMTQYYSTNCTKLPLLHSVSYRGKLKWAADCKLRLPFINNYKLMARWRASVNTHHFVDIWRENSRSYNQIQINGLQNNSHWIKHARSLFFLFFDLELLIDCNFFRSLSFEGAPIPLELSVTN